MRSNRGSVVRQGDMVRGGRKSPKFTYDQIFGFDDIKQGLIVGCPKLTPLPSLRTTKNQKKLPSLHPWFTRGAYTDKKKLHTEQWIMKMTRGKTPIFTGMLNLLLVGQGEIQRVNNFASH